MARNRRKRLPAEPVAAHVESLAHDGRGVAHIEGKTVFIAGALPGEEVTFRYTSRRRSHDEGRVDEVLEASPQRVVPGCAHAALCGGCSLQHLAADAQIEAKQQVLLEGFRRLGKVEPERVLPPLTGPAWGYRRKARLGVKYVIKKRKLLIGFREKGSGLLAELERCEVLHPSVGHHLRTLAQTIAAMEAYDRIAQVEVAVAEEGTALVFRNLDPLSVRDTERLRALAREHGFLVYLQPGGPESITPLWPERIELSYTLPAHGLRMRFEPTDFTQVNLDINRAMIDRALELLDPQPGERVLDLFCGLGNFTLPLARSAGEVVGVEGDAALVQRARENAERNGVENVQFHTADLAGELDKAPWWGGGFDRALLDPPRTGARETLAHLAALGIGRIVYVSCNPATLARDAGILVNDHGYRLVSAGVMDMFPHTAHVESIALFEKV